MQVNSGALGSTGKIGGAVTVGDGTTAGAILLPGTATKPGTLTINNSLALAGNLTIEVNKSASPSSDKLVVEKSLARDIDDLVAENVKGRLAVIDDAETSRVLGDTVFRALKKQAARSA